MALKVLQVNTNHSKVAQDLAIQRSLEDLMGVLCITEPYRVPTQDFWFSDNTGKAAILGAPMICNKIKLMDRGNGFVAIKTDAELFYSYYISPNNSLEDFDLFLQELGDSLTKYEGDSIIITGDFNTKHKAWGSKTEDNRGWVLLEWIVQHKLIILNEGQTSTCYRSSGESVIDLSLCTENIAMRISN